MLQKGRRVPGSLPFKLLLQRTHTHKKQQTDGKDGKT